MSGWIVEARAADGVQVPIELHLAEKAVAAVLAAEAVATAEISLAFVSDPEIAALNERYLAHEGPTDVMSFPLHIPGGPPLGDVYVGVEQAIRQAADAGIAPREEILRLCVHGALHILGYDHPEGGQRESSPMYLRQEELLAAFVATIGGSEAGVTNPNDRR